MEDSSELWWERGGEGEINDITKLKLFQVPPLIAEGTGSSFSFNSLISCCPQGINLPLLPHHTRSSWGGFLAPCSALPTGILAMEQQPQLPLGTTTGLALLLQALGVHLVPQLPICELGISGSHIDFI